VVITRMALKSNRTFVQVLDRSGVREFFIFNLNAAIAIPEQPPRAPTEARTPDYAVDRRRKERARGSPLSD